VEPGTKSPDSSRERYRIQSVDRALTALDFLGEARREGVTLSEVSRRLGTSKSTALSLLRTLAERGFVAIRDDGDGPRYRLGLALARLGDRVLAQTELLDVALPLLRQLTEQTQRTSRVGVLDDGFVVAIGHVAGPGFIQVRSHLGRRELPHCSALGKAILSQLPEDEVRRIIRRSGLPARTPRTITDFDDLLVELQATRGRGYALDDEEDSVGVFCVGAPVFDHRSDCAGAISVTGVRLSSTADVLGEVAEAVRNRADELSRLLGREPS
jgi:IclR family transcriptional regulator, acetate operon repressor